ncbi:MAG: hypothetical protein CVV05_12085 [Gammaproteobacteria bacterium HGW-Gammaproteobacteria-1]|jgi:hypothetical protein|nr:MAG: hypothetical protein CVV05_12085 [Gammaproteobacteria bacterium HGW-Gammaproteobacteria-1]
MWDNVALVALVLWPAVILIAALINMLFAMTFSWSELVIDYLIGVVIGVCFYFGTTGQVSGIEHFFLMLSTGLFGLLKWAGVDALADPQVLFLVAAGSVIGATLLTAALDYAALALGTTMSVGGGFLSAFIFLLKAPFAMVTTVVGLVIGLIGVIVGLVNGKGGFGFLGGVFYFEWGRGGPGDVHATTFGSVVNVFAGKMSSVMAHELYHSRQYIYLHDWLGVFYFTVAGLWGLISSAAAKNFSVYYFYAADRAREYGNPIETVAYRKWG